MWLLTQPVGLGIVSKMKSHVDFRNPQKMKQQGEENSC